MNFDYDPQRHPPEVGRVLDRMAALINSGRRSGNDPINALCAAMDEIAKENGVEYAAIESIVFAAIKQGSNP